MKYIILEKAKEEDEEKEPSKKKKGKAKVGHVILVDGGKDAEITATGKDGVTARDKKGKKHQVLHEEVEVKNKKKDKKEKDEKDEDAD